LSNQLIRETRPPRKAAFSCCKAIPEKPKQSLAVPDGTGAFLQHGCNTRSRSVLAARSVRSPDKPRLQLSHGLSVILGWDAIKVGDDLLYLVVEQDAALRIEKLSLFDDHDNLIASVEQNKLWETPAPSVIAQIEALFWFGIT
jgi:hypothetical protein